MDILVEITIRAYAGAMMEPAIRELNFSVPAVPITPTLYEALSLPDMRESVANAIGMAAHDAVNIENDRIDREPEPFADAGPEPEFPSFDRQPA